MERAPRIAITCGEPAGIGYELVAAAAMRPQPAALVACGDPQLLRERSRIVTVDDEPLTVEAVDDPHSVAAAVHTPGRLPVWPFPLPQPAVAGRLNPANAGAVLASLQQAAQRTVDGTFDAVVTAPVHKGVFNDAGIAFSGHTELFAELLATPTPVMMLVAGELRVALATTHLPLREVADALTTDRLEAVITALHHDLVDKFAIAIPRIAVTGLNPHAGESGHLGREEIEIIAPVLERLRAAGFYLIGPLPADTAFTPAALGDVDAVLAMYHDQGLPVLKHVGFGRAVNVTLGLPIIRTSVDHGTALELAGSGRADGGSLQAAIDLAAELAVRRSPI